MSCQLFSVTVRLGIALFAMSAPATAFAQSAAQPKAQARPAAPAPANGFDAEVMAAKTAMMGDPETALKHARSAISLSRNEPNPQARLIGEATGHWLEGEALIRVNRPAEAQPAIERGMAIVVRQGPGTKLHADLVKARAALSQVNGAVQSALSDLLAAHKMFQSLNEPRSQSIVLQNIGSIYLEARDFERALRYYAQAKDVYPDDPALALAAHNNRGNALKELRKYAEAEKEFEEALKAARAMESDLLQARILSNLASAQMLKGDLGRADSTALLGLRISHRSALGWEPFLWGVRAQIAFARGDLQSARRLMESTFKGVDLNASTLPFREFHDTARQIYFRLGDSASAFRHLSAFKRLDDEARNIASTTSSALMTARFDSANQELRIAKREAELASSRQRLERLKLMALIGVLTALAIFAVGFLAFRAVQRSRNRVAEANVRLSHAARHDALTGLPNRRYVREQLDEKLNYARTHG